MTTEHRRGRVAVASAALLVTAAACGLPDDGSVRSIDDDTVPYRLLEDGSPPAPALQDEVVPGAVPVVLWVFGGDRLVPSASGSSCAEPAETVTQRLLDQLVAGPSEEMRAAGRSTAIPPESDLTLVEISDGTAVLDLSTDTPISADRLPAAVGQVVLTVGSVAGIRSVVVLDDSAPAQLPLPGGALADGPVTPEDYVDLVPDRFLNLGEPGCRDS